MKVKLILCICMIVVSSCKNTSQKESEGEPVSNLDVANEFIDAYYSFDNKRLESVLAQAGESSPAILYYQKWAECGNYEIIERHACIEHNDSVVICPVTVKDDLISTLKLDLYVTDTFHLTIREGQIRHVETSSNDPDMYYEATEWVKLNRPVLIEKPCEGIWEDGPTPCECVRAMVEGFNEFLDYRSSEPGLESP